jgi:hypothetical protein
MTHLHLQLYKSAKIEPSHWLEIHKALKVKKLDDLTQFDLLNAAYKLQHGMLELADIPDDPKGYAAAAALAAKYVVFGEHAA